MIKKALLIATLIILAFLGGWYVRDYFALKDITQVFPIPSISRPLDKYSIENLSNDKFIPGAITLEKTITDDPKYTSWLYSMLFEADIDGHQPKKVTGQVNIPKEAGSFPVVVMFRGYIDQQTYTTGDGTRNAAKYFAENGFITIAPDFLGYGGSDSEAGDIFESRFQTYVAALSTLASVNAPSFTEATGGKWDGKNIFVWGHSNGGQITLTALEASGVDYPTVLWAPVSKPFPYSVLYYTDESDDGGRFIRHELSRFEDLYDSNLYSLSNYFDMIRAPIQLHQGTADDAVNVSWSDALEKNLKNNGVEVEYFKYPGDDHNMRPDWDTVVARNVEFYRSHLKPNS